MDTCTGEGVTTSTATSLQSLWDDPLLLQDLVLKEKSREFDQDLNLESALCEPCLLVEWTRLRRIFLSDKIIIRLKNRIGEKPLFIVTRPNQCHTFVNSDTVDIRKIQDINNHPPFIKELLDPQDSSDDSGGYALLTYEYENGWVLMGCLASLTPSPPPSPIPPSEFQDNLPTSTTDQVVGDADDTIPLASPPPAPVREISRNFVATRNCPTCNKEVLASVYDAHLSTHDPTHWLRCAICDFRSDCPDKIKQHIAEEHPESQISLPCTQETLPPPVESPPRMTIDNPSIIRSSSPSTHSTPRSRHRSQLDMEDVSPIAATPVTSGVHANIPRRLVTELFSSEALVDAQDTDSPKDKSSPPLLDCYSSSSEAVVESMKRRRLSTSSSSDVPRVSKRKKTIASSSSSSSPLSSASSWPKKKTLQRPLTRSQRRSTQKREFKCDICRKKCTTQRSLDAHLKTHEESDDDTTSSSSSFVVSESEESTSSWSSSGNSESRRVSTRSPMSKEWLCCPHCDYKSHRPDFFQIHLDVSHPEKKKTGSSAKSRPLVADSSPSSSSIEVVYSAKAKKSTKSSKTPRPASDSSSPTPQRDASTPGRFAKCPVCQKKVRVVEYMKHAAEHRIKVCVQCDFTTKNQHEMDVHKFRQHTVEMYSSPEKKS